MPTAHRAAPRHSPVGRSPASPSPAKDSLPSLREHRRAQREGAARRRAPASLEAGSGPRGALGSPRSPPPCGGGAAAAAPRRSCWRSRSPRRAPLPARPPRSRTTSPAACRSAPTCSCATRCPRRARRRSISRSSVRCRRRRGWRSAPPTPPRQTASWCGRGAGWGRPWGQWGGVGGAVLVLAVLPQRPRRSRPCLVPPGSADAPDPPPPSRAARPTAGQRRRRGGRHLGRRRQAVGKQGARAWGPRVAGATAAHPAKAASSTACPGLLFFSPRRPHLEPPSSAPPLPPKGLRPVPVGLRPLRHVRRARRRRLPGRRAQRQPKDRREADGRPGAPQQRGAGGREPRGRRHDGAHAARARRLGRARPRGRPGGGAQLRLGARPGARRRRGVGVGCAAAAPLCGAAHGGLGGRGGEQAGRLGRAAPRPALTPHLSCFPLGAS
jgi:hypothetical protein